MKNARRSGDGLVLGLLALAALGGGAIFFALSREKEDIVRPRVHANIDLPQVSQKAEAEIASAADAPRLSLDIPAPPPPKAGMGVVAPIPLDGMSGSRPKAGAVSPGKVPVVTAAAVRWVRTHKAFAAFLKAPARYLAGKGDRMSSPSAFKAFLDDKKQVDAFLDAPVVRVALNSPVITRALLGDPGVVKTFLGSPAMQDASTVKALLTSRLFEKVLDCPGPQGAIEDGRTLPGVLTNPAVIGWLKENPTALKSLSEAIPALAAMNPGVPRKRK